MTNPITNWEKFREVTRSPNCRFLTQLDRFHNSVLISGCQRSGTTMLTSLISKSEGMVKYFDGEDGELKGALILLGLVQHEPMGRYCFQTTYLDNAYHEYFNYIGRYKLIWLLRNPYSTIYSLLYNWPNYALYETFETIILPSLGPLEKLYYYMFGKLKSYRLRIACSIYNYKIQQIPLIRSRLNDSSFAVVDYDDFVEHKDAVLPMIYGFINLPYSSIYADRVHMDRVFRNVIGNAIKYTAEGSVQVKAEEDGGFIKITIADTGIGIPEEDLPRIFEIFHRAANAKAAEKVGTGLGLSIVKRIVEDHWGTIAVESCEGEGCTFTIRLPKAKQARL